MAVGLEVDEGAGGVAEGAEERGGGLGVAPAEGAEDGDGLAWRARGVSCAPRPLRRRSRTPSQSARASPSATVVGAAVLVVLVLASGIGVC